MGVAVQSKSWMGLTMVMTTIPLSLFFATFIADLVSNTPPEASLDIPLVGTSAVAGGSYSYVLNCYSDY